MKLARSIKIGAHTWRIKRMLKTPPEGAEYDLGDDGLCSFASHVIWLGPKVINKPALLAETLFHEVTHAINDHCGVTDGATEEHFTTQSAKGWAQVVADNHWLLPYLNALLHPAAKPESVRPRPESCPGDPVSSPAGAAASPH